MSQDETTSKSGPDLSGYYAYAYLALTDGNYGSAVRGFRYTLRNQIEPEKSIMGLICSYCCLGHYSKAVDAYNRHSSILSDSVSLHKLVNDLSYFLNRDVSALNLRRRNYLASIRLNFTMKRVCESHEADPSNVVGMILLSYWLAYAGYSCDSTSEASLECLYLKTLDDGFRWKLLARLSVENKELLSDDDLAGLFSDIPDELVSDDYINTLILSKLYEGDLETARRHIESLREKGHVFTNEVLWNFTKLSVDEDEVDDLAVNFAKHLISEGWMDPYVAEVIRYGYANRTRYSVRKELNALELMNL